MSSSYPPHQREATDTSRKRSPVSVLADETPPWMESSEWRSIVERAGVPECMVRWQRNKARRKVTKRLHDIKNLSSEQRVQKSVRCLNKSFAKLGAFISQGRFEEARKVALRIRNGRGSHRAAMKLMRRGLPKCLRLTDQQIIDFPQFRADGKGWDDFDEDTRIQLIEKKDGSYRKVYSRGLRGKIIDWLDHQIALRFRPYPDNQMRQPGKSVRDAHAELIEQIENGATHVYQIDIKDFYPSIPHIYIWAATKLDRVSRSLKDMLDILEKLEQKGVGFRSLTESVDTTTNAGRMMMQMLGAFAEFERNMIRSRVNDGLQQAKKRGVKFGRPRALDQSQREAAIEMHQQGKSYSEIGRIVGCSYQTVARVCQAQGNDTAETAAPDQQDRPELHKRTRPKA